MQQNSHTKRRLIVQEGCFETVHATQALLCQAGTRRGLLLATLRCGRIGLLSQPLEDKGLRLPVSTPAADFICSQASKPASSLFCPKGILHSFLL